MSDQTATRDSGLGPDDDSGLKRSITGRLLFFYVLGDVLGSGIYVLIGSVAGAVGGAFWIAFAVGVTVATVTGMAYAELVTKYPQAAGAALYVNKAFQNRMLTFLVTVTFLASSFAAAGALATGFAQYFAEVWELPPTLLVTLVFILLLAVVNYIGITESVVANMVMTFVEIAGLVIIMIIGVIYVAEGNADFGTLTDFDAGAKGPIYAIIAGVALAFFAMTGFENAANVAEETVNPSKTFPRALVGGMVAAGVIYVLVAMTAALVVPTGQLAKSDAALLEVVEAGVLPISVGVMSIIFAVIAMTAITNTTLVAVVTQARILYGMAREDVVPDAFAKIHPVRRSPVVGLIFSAAVVCALLIIGTLAQRGRVRHRHRDPSGDRHRGAAAVHLRDGHRGSAQAEGAGRDRGHLPGQHGAAGRRAGGQRAAARVRRLRRPGVADLVRRAHRARVRALPHRVRPRLAEPPVRHRPRRVHARKGRLTCT